MVVMREGKVEKNSKNRTVKKYTLISHYYRELEFEYDST